MDEQYITITCTACGRRIEASAFFAGDTVKCKCGAPIVIPSISHPTPSPRQAEVEICANCDARIGRLEQAYIWQNKVVCKTCYSRLAQDDRPKPPPPPEEWQNIRTSKQPPSRPVTKKPSKGRGLTCLGCIVFVILIAWLMRSCDGEYERRIAGSDNVTQPGIYVQHEILRK